ncbi:major facilitator superfamily domain-containing 8-like, partial [Paramuricea clavata]
SFKRRLRPKFPFTNTALFIYISIRITVDGLEEYLIMPTAWYYIKELGETTFFLGVTLAAYSFGALVTAPFIGALDDRFHITKPILIVSAVCKFLGHLTYTIPVNAYFPLCGRLLSGIAAGSMGVMHGVISRYTEKEDRAKAFVFFGAMFNVGTALAPSIGSVINFNFNIFGWTIGKGNSPGLFLAIIWFLMVIATVFCIPRNAGHENFFPLTQIGPGARSDDEIDGELETNNRPIIDCTEVPSNDEIIYINNTDVTCNTTLLMILISWSQWLEYVEFGGFAFFYTRRWLKDRPATSQIRRRVLVHPASTMWISDDLDYRFRGVENVYLTGTQPAP